MFGLLWYEWSLYGYFGIGIVVAAISQLIDMYEYHFTDWDYSFTPYEGVLSKSTVSIIFWWVLLWYMFEYTSKKFEGMCRPSTK